MSSLTPFESASAEVVVGEGAVEQMQETRQAEVL